MLERDVIYGSRKAYNGGKGGRGWRWEAVKSTFSGTEWMMRRGYMKLNQRESTTC